MRISKQSSLIIVLFKQKRRGNYHKMIARDELSGERNSQCKCPEMGDA